MHEVKLTEKAARLLCVNIAQAPEEAGATIVSEDDYQQLACPTDQIYIDYTWQNKVFTLHLEHVLGISIFSEELDIDELDDIASKVRSGIGM
jgi:hypothetical protein